MKLQLFIATLLTMSLSFAAGAADLDATMKRVTAKIAQNSPPDTEQKMGRLLSAYAEIMSTLSNDIAVPLTGVLHQGLGEAEGALANGRNVTALSQLEAQLLQVAQGITSTNAQAQKLASDIYSLLDGVKNKFPNATFVTASTFDQLVAHSRNFAITYGNLSVDASRCMTKLTEVRQAISANDPALARKVQELAQESNKVRGYSFQNIGQNFVNLQAYLQSVYP